MARRSTYLASLAPVALFLAAMVSADGKNRPLSPSSEPVASAEATELQFRTVPARPAERLQLNPLACSDRQSCYDAQLRRLQESALH